MCVLFGFGNARLRFAVFGKPFAQSILYVLRRICRVETSKGRVVLRHTDIVRLFITARPLELVELRLYRGARYFAGAVGTEIVEYYAVAVLDAFIVADYGRFYELVESACRIRRFYARKSVRIARAYARKDAVVSEFYSVPALISVHVIISSDNGSHLARTYLLGFFFKLGDVVLGGIGRHVSAVGYAMDIHVFDGILFGEP